MPSFLIFISDKSFSTRCQCSDPVPNIKITLYSFLKILFDAGEDPEGAWPLHQGEKDYYFANLKRRVECVKIKNYPI